MAGATRAQPDLPACEPTDRKACRAGDRECSILVSWSVDSHAHVRRPAEEIKRNRSGFLHTPPAGFPNPPRFSWNWPPEPKSAMISPMTAIVAEAIMHEIRRDVGRGCAAPGMRAKCVALSSFHMLLGTLAYTQKPHWRMKNAGIE